MLFGLKNAPSEFQNIMKDIFDNYTRFPKYILTMFLYFLIQ